MQLYENARAFMREHGNPGQWGTTYPPQNMIETDIRFGNLYVCIEKILSKPFSSIKTA